MAKKKIDVNRDKKRYNQGIRREILELTQLCGAIPYKAMEMLNINIRCLHYKINDMEKEGLICVDKRKNNWMVYLNEASEKTREIAEKYIDKNYRAYYKNNNKNDEKHRMTSGEESKMLRAKCNNEVIIFFRGIRTMLGPYVESLSQTVSAPSYYSLRDIKIYLCEKFNTDITDSTILRSARITGIYLTKSESFAIYYSPYMTTLYTADTEYQIQSQIERILSNQDDKKIRHLNTAIVMDKNRAIIELIETDISKKSRKNGIEQVYKEIYAIPCDKNGQKMVQIMSLPDWKQKLINDFELTLDKSEEITAAAGGYDGYDAENDIYTYLFCKPEIKTFRTFINRARKTNCPKKYRVICFDFQKDLVKELCRGICTIFISPIDEYIPKEFLSNSTTLIYNNNSTKPSYKNLTY